jgi:hypothetical protein
MAQHLTNWAYAIRTIHSSHIVHKIGMFMIYVHNKYETAAATDSLLSLRQLNSLLGCTVLHKIMLMIYMAYITHERFVR